MYIPHRDNFSGSKRKPLAIPHNVSVVSAHSLQNNPISGNTETKSDKSTNPSWFSMVNPKLEITTTRHHPTLEPKPNARQYHFQVKNHTINATKTNRKQNSCERKEKNPGVSYKLNSLSKTSKSTTQIKLTKIVTKATNAAKISTEYGRD
jgi:hypothetical protein